MRFVHLLLLVVLGSSCRVDQRLAAPYPTRYMFGKADDVSAVSIDIKVVTDSMRLRREMAWRLVDPLLRRVSAVYNENQRVPRWLTFYDNLDINVAFPLFLNFSKLQPNANNAMLLSKTWDATAKNLETIPSWSRQRFEKWQEDITTNQDLVGRFGLVRSLYSPRLLEHVLLEMNKVVKCEDLSEQKDAEDRLASANFSICFDNEFPKESVAVKAVWQRAADDGSIPYFSTSPDQFASHIERGDWSVTDGDAVPGNNKSLSLTIGPDATFHLVGLHIVRKVVRDWYWITLWWSPEPDSDFGSDRPVDFAGGELVWQNYKMCTSVAYEDKESPDVATEALQRNHEIFQAKYPGRSWCSNPYIEEGANNAATNCIGCHQHAGASISQESILEQVNSDGKLLRLDKVRKNFPTDYIYGVTHSPERMSGVLRIAVKEGGTH